MDIFFQDPNEIPLPPDEVRIREFRAEPWPDGYRVKIYLEVDPFQKRPSADVVLHNAAGDEVANTSVIGSISRTMEFNVHLREEDPAGAYIATVVLYYVDFPEAGAAEGEGKIPELLVVDRSETTFDI